MTEDGIRPSAPLLTTQDLASPTWAKLKQHMEAQQAKLRLKNETDLDPVATANARGRLKVYASLLALANPSPVMVADEERE